MPIRVALIEDDGHYREALAAIFHGTPGFCCVGAYPNAEVALDHLPSASADVALVDIKLPLRSGIEFVRQLKSEAPGTLAVMLTIFEDSALLFDSLEAGAHGYVLKSCPPSEIIAAVKDVVDGGGPMSRSIARKVIQRFHTPRSAKPALPELTDREEQILAQLATGYAQKTIGARMGVSHETVRSHVHKIYKKLHVRSRIGAVLKYIRSQ